MSDQFRSHFFRHVMSRPQTVQSLLGGGLEWVPGIDCILAPSDSEVVAAYVANFPQFANSQCAS